ncbi:HNH endonuclease [Candidatus Accumulibacter phosphatis]|uniref:HNH endonuclease n=1 Tax=Candidatus Accumulibacter phosphatis TaxID=327160 RepID=UPI00110A2A00|nr:HNH endonuclease [Candidatus Accumulibacter phosphatis]
MKQLDRLLFEQGGDCFFCKQPLAKADASIEHLLAQANGGTSAEENVVACCKAINSLLGNKPLKEKFAIILRQRHGFQCPARQSVASSVAPPLAATKSPPAPALATPAPKAPTSQPAAQERKGQTSAPCQATLAVVTSSAKPRVASTKTCPTCQHSVPAAVGQIDFVCPKCGGAFRY